VARVYPNPTAGLLHLQIDNARAQPVEIAIISTTGQVLHQNRHDNPGSHFSALLDLSNRAPGVYLVRITVNGASLIRKVIVE
jgi:hypothetical protein